MLSQVAGDEANLLCLHFKGRTSRAAPDSESLRTVGSATSCVISTIIRGEGVESDLKASDDGGLAFLDSELRVTGPDSFRADGTITFGDTNQHLLCLSTLGEGHFTSSIHPGIVAGAVSWKIEGGAGQFDAAKGLITSTFTLSETGEFNDWHCGLIFLPE